MDRTSCLRGLLLAAVVAGLVAGCGGGSSSGGGTPVTSGGSSPVVTPTTASTGPLFDSDFEPVCQGATQSRATAYDTTATTHKALYFETFTDDLLNQSSEDLPTDWTIQYSASDPTAFSGIDVVGCGVRTSATLVKTCSGYKDNNGKAIDNTLQLYTAKYTLTVREATTGKVLSTTKVSSDDSTCPAFASFDAKVTKQYDSIPKATVVAALKPFVQK